MNTSEKANSPPLSTILRGFQSQKCQFTIPKFLARLTEKLEKEVVEEHRQFPSLMCFTQTY